MSRMFCTLKEAAKTLNASEDQIDALLERGLLQEFREGPHRLLKETDVGALALKRRPRSKPQRPVPPPPQAKRPSPTPGAKAQAGRPGETKLPHAATVVSRPPRSRKTEDRGRRTQDQGPRTQNSARTMESHSPVCPMRSAGPPPATRPSEGWSVRRWFWMGLIQDRPVVIALLSGLVLLILSALAAGLCFVAEGL